MEGIASYILIGILAFLQLRPAGWWTTSKVRKSNCIIGIVISLTPCFIFISLLISFFPIPGSMQALFPLIKQFIPEILHLILGILIYRNNSRVFQFFVVTLFVDILSTGYALTLPVLVDGFYFGILLQVITYLMLGTYLWRMQKLGYLGKQ